MSDIFYRNVVPASAQIAASLDTVARTGTVEGWARYTNSPLVCHIQVRLDNVVVAEDMADKFRADLLKAGVGHGHCAFYARLTALPPGRYRLRLFDGRTNLPIENAADAWHEVPAPAVHNPHSIEYLLHPRDRWNDADILEYPNCLQLAENCRALGPERFVDRVFRFALGRWADQDGGQHYAEAIRSGEMSPNDVFNTVMTSAERQSQERPLSRPMDPDYPFFYSPDL